MGSKKGKLQTSNSSGWISRLIMDTKLLKQKILDLAIHGKLVPQNPNDEPASKLLEKIREEKQKLVDEKKIKADKNDSYIFVGDDNRHYEKFADGSVKDIEDEIPFEIPEGWAWCRLKEILDISSAKRVLQEDWKDSGIPFYRAREIAQLSNGEKVKDDLFITPDLYNSLKENYGVPQPNDLMVSAVGTIGKCYIVKETDCFYYKDASVLRFAKRSLIFNSSFLKTWIESDFIQSQMYSHSNGTTVDTITISTAQEYLFPLPPLNEQLLIVTKINTIFNSINHIESDKSELLAVIKQAKSKILDLAIHGKLVPQDPSDEPASVLLGKLRAEKEAKIKAGELKRDKNDSYIYKNTTDNCYYEKFNDNDSIYINDKIPFEIPNNWQWVKLNEIADIARGGSPRPIEAYITDSSDGINWIKIGDTSPESKYITRANEKIKPDGRQHSRFVHAGDFLLTNSMSFGRPYILKIDGCIHDGWLVFGDIRSCILKDFLYLALTSDYIYSAFSTVAAGSTVKNLKSETVKQTFFPLPPISEQERIVSKIEEMFNQLDQIQSNLI